MALAGFGSVINGVLGKLFSSRHGELSKDVEQGRGVARFSCCTKDSWGSQMWDRLESGGANTGCPWRAGGRNLERHGAGEKGMEELRPRR